MRSTAMIMLIILAAVFLNFVLGFMGVTAILEAIKELLDAHADHDRNHLFLSAAGHVHGDTIHDVNHDPRGLSHCRLLGVRSCLVWDHDYGIDGSRADYAAYRHQSLCGAWDPGPRWKFQ